MAQRVHRMPGIMPTQRIQKPKKPINYRLLFTVITVVIVIIGGYWALFRSPVLSIQSIEIVGTADNPSIKTVTDKYVGQNMIQLNSATLTQTLEQAYPPIQSVSIIRGLPHTLRITLTLRQPMLRWQVNDKVSILDQNGIAYAEGDQPQFATLPKIVDKSGITVTLGQTVVSPQYIQFMTDAAKQIPDLFKQPVQSFEITETTFFVDVVLQNNIRIRLTTQRPLKEQLDGALFLMSNHPDAKTIDVRVPKLGYWKTS